MSIPAIGPFLPPEPIRSPAVRITYKNITRLCLFGGTVGTVMIIASAAILSFSLLIAGFGTYCLTALTALSWQHHNFKLLSKNVRHNLRELENEVVEITRLMPTIGERLALLEKEFLNRGRYKYIDETPEGPPSAPSSVSSSAESSPKSSRLSTDSLPR